MGFLIFENDDGGIQALDAITLRQILCRREVQVVSKCL